MLSMPEGRVRSYAPDEESRTVDGFNGSKAWQPDTENKHESNHSADLLQIWDHAGDF